MARLTEQQRRFVVAVLQQTVVNATQAAKDAGYSDVADGAKVRGHELMHNPKVLAALKEEMGKRIALGAIVGIYGLQAIAADPDHKDHLRACVALADRGGYSPIVHQEIKVEHTDRTGAALMDRIKELAQKHGLDPEKLLAGGSVSRETKLIELKAEEKS
jgi:hypothetical protein